MFAGRFNALVSRALRHEIALFGSVEVVHCLRAAACALFADAPIEAHEQHCVREAARLPEKERDVEQCCHQHEAHADHYVSDKRRDPGPLQIHVQRTGSRTHCA